MRARLANYSSAAAASIYGTNWRDPREEKSEAKWVWLFGQSPRNRASMFIARWLQLLYINPRAHLHLGLFDSVHLNCPPSARTSDSLQIIAIARRFKAVIFIFITQIASRDKLCVGREKKGEKRPAHRKLTAYKIIYQKD